MAKNLRGVAAQVNAFPNNQRLATMGAHPLALTAYKPALQTVNASVVLVTDTDLQLNLGMNGYWFVEVNANIAIANAAHNIRYAFAGLEGLVTEAASVSLGRGFLGISGVAGQEDPITNVSITVTGGTTSAWTSLRIAMGFHILQPGVLALQFAQNVSGASNTSIQGGSTMKATYFANQLNQ